MEEGRAGRRPALLVFGEKEVGEVVDDALVRAVLFVDLEDARVLVIGGRENFRRFAGKENAGVGAAAIDETADDDHAREGQAEEAVAMGMCSIT
jgi:hypothetical protein